MVLRNSSNNPRMRRRQHPTSRKKSSAVSNVKTRLDPTVAKKKLRKGYVYEEVPADVPQSCLLGAHNGCLPSTYSDCGTQTLGSSHLFSALIEKIMNEQADFIAGATPNMPISLPSYVSRRLMFTQQVLLQQSEALDKMYKENTRLERVIKAVVSVVRKFRDEYASDLLCLRDSVKILKREFAFYQEEFVEEANKSMDNIQALKEQFQRKLEDYERKNRLLNARIELHIKEREAAEERADGYLRDIHTRDREVILANKLRDRAERKLKDSLYVANNAKCAHCQISEKMRTHLTSVVAEKTIMLEKCQKECSDLHRRADQADRISQILSKDSEKLRFELNTWKSDAERNLMEISRLKGEGITPRESPLHSNSPTPRIPTGKATPNDYGDRVAFPIPISAIRFSAFLAVSTPSDSTTKEQADTQRLSRPPEAHIMPTPPEEPDSPRLPRERKVECSPKASFFSAPSSSVRHVHPTVVGWRNTPSNELVLRDRSASRLDARAASPPSLIESDKNDVSKHDDVAEEQISRKSRAKEFSGVSDGTKGSHRNGRSSRSKVV
uniref:Uncharacterized protein n=1 Tax=Angiostrongylus cantonensis TaxID=6313 RepID=A0A0K0D9C5_ANGCA